MPWIQRQFDLDQPASLFPNVLERLRGTPARVEDRVRGLPQQTLVARRGDSWSIQEHLGHLLAVEALWHGRVDDFAAAREVLRAADMENRRTYAADYNSQPLTGILSELRASRLRLVARLAALDEVAIERAALHPRLNRPMRVLDLMVFAAEHDDHHLARVSELMRAFGTHP